MKFILTGLFIICYWFPTNAQSLKERLTGAWVCTDAELAGPIDMPPDGMDVYLKFSAAVVSSKLLFKNDGLFEWQFQDETLPAIKELKFLNNKEWVVNEKDSTIRIAPKENLMQIEVQHKEGNTYFLFSETPLLLTVKKQPD